MSKSGVKCTAPLVMQMHSQESNVIVSFRSPFQENATFSFQRSTTNEASLEKGDLLTN